MTWIADTISARRTEILDEVAAMLPEVAEGAPFTGDEMVEQAGTTLDHLVEALRTHAISPLFSKWEAVGKACAARDLSIDEVPNLPDILKRAIWRVMRPLVESGEVDLGDLVDWMMDVDSLLADCRFALVRSFLETEDAEMLARTERIETLYSLTEVLSAQGDGADINRSIVEKVSSITGLPRCSLLLFDEAGSLGPVSSNYPDDVERLALAGAEAMKALAAMISSGSPRVVEKGSGDKALETLLSEYHTPVILAVPMRTADSDVGMLLLDAGHDGDFTSEQTDMAVASASQAAIAIEKSELLGEMESRLKHMAAIGIVARSLTSHLDPGEQLESLLEMATALMRADGGCFLLQEEMFGELHYEAGTGQADWWNDGGFKAMALWAFENAVITSWSRGESDPRFEGPGGVIEACLVAPLMVQDKPIGVISVATIKEGERYSRDDVELFGNFSAQAAMALENTRLYERLQDTYLGAIGSLAAAIEARDPYTVGHSARVTQYAVAIAESMGLPGEEVEDLRLAGLLHDLGKIGVPDSILNKAGRLSEEEYSAIKMHPALSMRIIEPLPHLGNIIPIIYHHHERYDGMGYMDGKEGNNIPLGARIIAVADSFEAMTSDRPYRKALTREEAMAELSRNAGSQFDPEVVQHFLALLEKSAP